jgi:hypothetical protein
VVFGSLLFFALGSTASPTEASMARWSVSALKDPCVAPRTLGPKTLFVGVKGHVRRSIPFTRLNGFVSPSQKKVWCVYNFVTNESEQPAVVSIVFLFQPTSSDEAAMAAFMRQTGYFSEVTKLRHRIYPYAKSPMHPNPRAFT